MCRLSRRSPRYRLSVSATLAPLLGGGMVVSKTKDISEDGVCLDTAAWFPTGTRMSISLIDPHSGNAIEVMGDVVREATQKNWSLGLVVIDPPAEWAALVAHAASTDAPSEKRKRHRVLVIGDEHRQRGAMALYVTSGWDVLFASDESSVLEALQDIVLDAVVAELDSADPRLVELMRLAKRVQPTARRIVRGPGTSEDGLVHRFVDRDAGLAPLLDAVSATY